MERLQLHMAALRKYVKDQRKYT